MKFVSLMHIGIPGTIGQKHSKLKMQDGRWPSFSKLENAQ